MRGCPKWDLIEELKPLETEDVVDGCGKGKFVATDLDMVLRTRGVSRLLFTGVTTACCVTTTMREATDLGYECWLISDGTGDSDVFDHIDTLRMAHERKCCTGGVIDTRSLLTALDGDGTPTSTKALAALPPVLGPEFWYAPSRVEFALPSEQFRRLLRG